MATQENVAIEFRNVTYTLPNGCELLRDLNLQIERGETLVLLGRSGSGKTTTIKLINGLLTPSSGDVLVDGRSLRDWNLIQLRRSIGYIIQEIGLFPHFSIQKNIGLVPTIEKWPAERVNQRVNELLQMVALDPSTLTRYPHQLSGGQRQRVGVARALAADPPILLMDEPFGALDLLTRGELQREFLSLQERLRKTVVFVTHDIRAALKLGTRIALMESGRIVTLLAKNDFLKSTEPLVIRYLEMLNGNDSHVRRGQP